MVSVTNRQLLLPLDFSLIRHHSPLQQLQMADSGRKQLEQMMQHLQVCYKQTHEEDLVIY